MNGARRPASNTESASTLATKVLALSVARGGGRLTAESNCAGGGSDLQGHYQTAH